MGIIIGNMAHRPGFGSSNGNDWSWWDIFLVQHNLHITCILTFFFHFPPYLSPFLSVFIARLLDQLAVDRTIPGCGGSERRA
jgi:hypothetical protein